MNKRLLPHDKDAEQGVLGGIIVNNFAIWQVSELLTPEHFFSPAHRELFKAMKALTERQDPIDELTLSNYLRSVGKYDMTGGIVYVAELVDVCLITANVLVYAEIVLKKWQAREAITSAVEMIKSLYDIGELNGQVDAFQKRVEAIADHGANLRSRSVSDALVEYSGWLDKHDAPSAFQAHFHINALDSVVGGITTERPTVLAARPGTGKTAMLTQVAVANARAGVPTLMLNLEMSERTITARILSAKARVSGERLIFRKLEGMTDADWDAMITASVELSGLPLYIQSPARAITAAEMESSVRWHQRNKGVRLVVIDHLYRIKSTARTTYEQTVERMMGVVEMQRALEIPVLVAVQINREGAAEPSMGNLKGGGDIEDNADVVIILHDDDPTSNSGRRIKARIAKNANGQRGDIELEYLPHIFTIR